MISLAGPAVQGPDQIGSATERSLASQLGLLAARLGPYLAAVLFLVALAILHRELAAYSYGDIGRAVANVPTRRLLLALAFTALSFAVLPGYDAMALRSVGHPLSLRRTAFGSFIAYAFSQALGTPLVTGGSVRYRLWSSWGLSAAEIALAVSFVAFSFSLGMMVVSGVVFLLQPARTAAILGLSPGALWAIGVVNLGLVAGYAGWSLLGGRAIKLGRWRLPAPGPGVVGAQVGIAALDWVLAGAALYALLPAGQRPGFLTFLGVFLIAQFAGLVSHVPGGLGVVESILVLLLARDIPPTTLLGALVAYRAVYYLLPFGIAVVMLGMHELRPYLPRVLSAGRVVVGWVPRLIPRVLSGAVFLSGATLLLSGAAPGDQGRLSWLNGILPLDVIQVSHFVGSLAGVGLVVLAWALWQRLDAAYGLTVVLLAAGLGVSVMRGGDWDEAAALSLVFGTVLPLRRTFYRRSALAGEPLEAGWLLSILVVAAASIWLGLFVPSQVLDGHQSWWRFAFSGNDPWLLRASVGLVAVALVVGVMRLVRHAPANVKPPSRAELDRAAALLTAWPDASANLALLGDKALLFSKSGRGVLMFGVEGRSWVALGDPVGDAADQMELAWRFSELADRHGGWPVFYQIGAHRLPLYIDLGLKLLKVGEEARVPLKDFSLEGPSRRGLRQNQRRIEREGVSFEVLPPGQVCSVLPELRLVSDTWLREKRTREKGFSLGRFDEAYVSRFPVAVARQQGRIIAFANVLTSVAKVELSIDLMRHVPEAPAGVMQYIFTELMLWGRTQDYQLFRLGMAPLSGFQPRALAPLWTRLGGFMYSHGEHFYNFKGLREYKEKFDPVWEPRYLASRGGLALPFIVANIATLISGGLKGIVAR